MMTLTHTEKFVTKVLPAYFFRHQELEQLTAPEISVPLKTKLAQILPRLQINKGGQTQAGMYLVDHYKAKTVTLAEIVDLSQKVTTGGLIFIVSHRDWGVKSLLKELAIKFGQESIDILERGMSGFRLLAVKKNHEPESSEEENILVKFAVKLVGGQDLTIELWTLPSLFSANHLDEGTRLLLESVNFSEVENILDIGAGWGAIGISALLANKKLRVTMTEANPRAIKIIKNNLGKYDLALRGKVIESIKLPTEYVMFDLIVSNPPYHLANRELVKIFSQAVEKITTNGKIILGTDKTYQRKFEMILKELGYSPKLIAKKGIYRVLEAAKLIRADSGLSAAI